MLGGLKLDKLRLNYKKQEVSQELREFSSCRLKELFPTAQSVSMKGLILNTFNPTKLVDSEREADYQHNLQMVSERRLAKALRRCFPKQMRDFITPSIIHIAGDYILKYPIQDYISMLANLDYAYLEGATVEADKSVSLYLSFNLNGQHIHFKIKFYDKGAEYCKKHDSPICKLYEPLSEKEIELLADSYNPENHSIDMSTANILRIEIELIQKDKLTPILNRVNGVEDNLTLPIILDALDDNKFYNVLKEVFHEKLRKYVFTATDTFEKLAEENNLSVIRQNAYKLQLEDEEGKHFSAIMEELGYSDSVAEMRRFLRKVVPDSELYSELYSAIFSEDEKVIAEEPTEELVATAPHSAGVDLDVGNLIWTNGNIASHDLYSTDLKDFILVYEVPIWDDS